MTGERGSIRGFLCSGSTDRAAETVRLNFTPMTVTECFRGLPLGLFTADFVIWVTDCFIEISCGILTALIWLLQDLH